MAPSFEAPELGPPEFGIPPLGIPERLLEEEDPGVGIEGMEDPAPALPPELLLCLPPALLELEDEDEPLLEEELPAEPDEPEDDDEEGEDDGEGIDEGICCSAWQPPIKNAPVAPAAASCKASMQARCSAALLSVLLTIASPARGSNSQTARGGAADYVAVELNRG